MSVEVKFKKKPAKVKWLRAGRDIVADARNVFQFNPDALTATYDLKKAKTSDEAKYTCVLEDNSGKELDHAGFSVFVKGLFLFSGLESYVICKVFP